MEKNNVRPQYIFSPFELLFHNRDNINTFVVLQANLKRLNIGSVDEMSYSIDLPCINTGILCRKFNFPVNSFNKQLLKTTLSQLNQPLTKLYKNVHTYW